MNVIPRYRRRAEAARYIRETWGLPCSSSWLAKLAVVGGGPIFRKAGRFPIYTDADLDQTVRKLQDLSIKWRKERAGRNFSRFRPIGRLMRPEGLRNARIRADEPHCLKPGRRRSSPRRRGC